MIFRLVQCILPGVNIGENGQITFFLPRVRSVHYLNFNMQRIEPGTDLAHMKPIRMDLASRHKHAFFLMYM